MNATHTIETIWISQQSWAAMRMLAAEKSPMETGGMLLGYQGENGEAVVTAIIGPGSRAKHKRFRFAPDHEYQQRQLEAHFSRTSGGETYLGDWHTHPMGTCELSRRDRRVLTRVALTPSSETPSPVMLVLAGEGTDWHACGLRYVSQIRKAFLVTSKFKSLTPRIYLSEETREAGTGEIAERE